MATDSTNPSPGEPGAVQRITLAIARQIVSIFAAMGALFILFIILNTKETPSDFAAFAHLLIYVCLGLIASIVGVILLELFELSRIRVRRKQWHHLHTMLHSMSEKSPELVIHYQLMQEMQRDAEHRTSRQSMVQNFVFFALGVATPLLLGKFHWL